MNRFKMEQCWRWFGPGDPVTLKDIKQTGASGIVTALHQIPHGELWTLNDILARKAVIEKEGFTWSVVESIPVHEDIKTRSRNFKKYIENYKASIRNLSRAGVHVVTYNFMPVNDWTRTSLSYTMPDGSLALYFNWMDLAVFDIYMLKRPDAAVDFGEAIAKKAYERFKNYSEADLKKLAGIVMAGIPGEEKNTPEKMLENILKYKDIDSDGLRENLSEFQREISEAADEVGIRLAIHPDDPPFPLFGLPRVVSRMSDFEYLFDKVPNTSNGVCFCTGSLGASAENNLPEMLHKLGTRVHFLHLRNVSRDTEGNFNEAGHLDGDNDMYTIVKEAVLLMQKLGKSIPFRPDHGHQMLDDLHKKSNPGYSAIGRMRGMAEIRGLELGVASSLEN